MTLEQHYAEYVAHKRDLQAQVKEVNEKMTELEHDILTDWQAQGVRSVKLESGATLYVSHDLRVASRNGTVETVKLFNQHALSDMLMPSSSKLRAYLKEMLHDDQTQTWELSNAAKALPTWLSDAVDLSEVDKLNVRGA